MASASVPAPPSGGGTQNPCSAEHAIGGGWAAADREARLYVSTDGRIAMGFPGGDGKLAFHPEHGSSRWC